MKNRAGKKSSPLDDIGPESWSPEMTKELLELLWMLETTLAMYPVLDDFLDEVLQGDIVLATELPKPTDAETTEPKIKQDNQLSLIE
jgi:hypothetical protein